MNRATRLANECLEKFGYCVVQWTPGPEPPPEPGSTISESLPARSGDLGWVKGPFHVISETDFEDYRNTAPPEFRQDIQRRMDAKYFRITAE